MFIKKVNRVNSHLMLQKLLSALIVNKHTNGKR